MICTPTFASVPVLARVRAPWSMPQSADVACESVYGTWQLGSDHRTIGTGHMGDTNHGTTGFKRLSPGFFDEVST